MLRTYFKLTIFALTIIAWFILTGLAILNTLADAPTNPPVHNVVYI